MSKTVDNTTPEALLAEMAERIEALSRTVDSLSRDNDSLSRQAAEAQRDAADAMHAVTAIAAELDEARAELGEARAERDEARAQRDQALAELERVIEKIKIANMRLYAPRTEKVPAEQMSFYLQLFNGAEADADPSVAEPALEDAVEEPKRERRRGGKRRLDYDSMETVVIEHVLPAGDAGCPECGSELADFKVEVTRTVKLVPAHLVVEEHRRHVYVCRECSKANAAGEEVPVAIVRAPMPKMPIPGSFASPSLLAQVLYGKYANALPLYRIEKDFERSGIAISRQNMANWTMSVHERWFSLIHARMKKRLLEGDVIHADETECQVLKEPGREAKQKSRMWLFAAPACDPPNFIFEYHETRSGKVAEDFLRGWSGYLTTDGYDPYFNLENEGVVNTACAVHVRRKFVDVIKSLDDGTAEAVRSVAFEGRRMLDAIFACDRKLREKNPDADGLKAARLKKLAPKMEAFGKWVRAQLPLAVPKMALYKALAYADEYWPRVMNVLKDGRLSLSNNLAENAIRPFVIGRKNHLFSDVPRGAAASAAIYSIVITAGANGLNQRLYMEWLLTEMPNDDHLLEPGRIDRYLPWSDEIPESCRLSKRDAAKLAEMPDDPIIDIDPEPFDEI